MGVAILLCAGRGRAAAAAPTAAVPRRFLSTAVAAAVGGMGGGGIAAVAVAVAASPLLPVLHRDSRASLSTHCSGPRAASAARRTLVTQISPTTSLLRSSSADAEVYLVGTAHISRASAEEVTDLVKTVLPDTVFVELDEARAAKLRYASTEAEEYFMFERGIRDMAARMGGMVGMASLPGGLGGFGGSGFGGAAGSGVGGGAGADGTGSAAGDMLSRFFKSFYFVLRRYGYVPGIEMKAAMDVASESNARLVCGDRDANETMRELGGALSNPATLLGALRILPPPELEEIMRDAAADAVAGAGGSSWGMEGLGDRVEALKTRDNTRLLTKWMSEAMPDVAEVIIRRRDAIMAKNLKEKCGAGRTVAVVGMAHVDGIEKEWKRLDTGTVALPSG